MVKENSPRFMVRVLAVLILLLALAVIFEGGARLAHSFRGKFFQVRATNLHVYQYDDPKDPSLWRLRPGFSTTLEQSIEESKKSGRSLALAHLLKLAQELHVQPHDTLFQIDADGYKGPELDHSHSHVRILTLGDSCTFGSQFDHYTYARTLERSLNQAGDNVEVVNGGVEGYGPREDLKRIREFQALKPEITTVYIGWNALYAEDAEPHGPNGFEFYSPWLIRSALSRLFPLEYARYYYNHAKDPDRGDPELQKLNGYVPPFMPDVEQIVAQMQASGSHVVILTLPGLFSLDEQPTRHALDIGHLPTYTENPFVLAKMSAQYNDALRAFATQHGIQLVDLQKWADATLKPRDFYFIDSVHLTERGQTMIGQYLAQQLSPEVGALESHEHQAAAH
jgi:lysophospholipase L1-like esterase